MLSRSLYTADLCTGGTIISGGDEVYYGPFPKANAFDNNTGTRWGSIQTGTAVNGGAFIGYDFGAGNSKSIRRVSYYTDITYNHNVSSIKVQYSDNFSAWTTAQTFLELPRSSTVWVDLNLDSDHGGHRYWRILANANLPATYFWLLFEVEMMELIETISEALTGSGGISFDSEARLEISLGMKGSGGIVYGGSAETNMMRGSVLGSGGIVYGGMASIGGSVLLSIELARQTARVLPLIEIVLDSGTLRYCMGAPAVETAEGPYLGRVAAMSAIERKAWLPWEGPSLTSYDITLDDGDAELVRSYDQADWMGRTVVLKLWAEGQTAVLHTGKIENVDIAEGAVILRLTDSWNQYFSDEARWYSKHILLPGDWPGLDESWVGRPGPVVLGVLDSTKAGYSGSAQAVPLSGSLYLCAVHAMQAVYPVWVGGEEVTSGFEVSLEAASSLGINGKVTLIEFDEVPSGQVTFDGRGLTDDLTSSGRVITNVAEQADALREYVYEVPDSLVDTLKIGDAKGLAEKRYLRGAGQITDNYAPTHQLHQLLSSAYLFAGANRNGEFMIWGLDQPIPDSGGVPVHAQRDITRGSWRLGYDTKALCNHLTIRYRDVQGKLYGSKVYEDAASQTALAREYRRELRCPFIGDWDVASHVADQALRMQSQCRVAAWTEQLQHLAQIDLGSFVAIHHPLAPDSSGNGWTGREFMVSRLAYDPNAYTLTVEALDVHAFAQAQMGQGFTLGDQFGGTLT